MFNFLDKSGCEGCEQRAEIMGAGNWGVDLVYVGAGVLLVLLIIYLRK